MTSPSPIQAFLTDQARRRRGPLALAAISAAAATASAALLLGLSGWFLAGAGLAGLAGPLAVQAFNYLLPSAGLRGLAIARTAGRYGERLFSHEAAFKALAALRPVLFAGLAAAPPEQSLAVASGEASAHLVQDVDATESEFVRRSAPWGGGAAAGAAAVAMIPASPWAAAAFLLGLGVQLAVNRTLAPRWTEAPGRERLRAVGELKASLNAYAAASAELRCFDLTGRAVAALMAHDEMLGVAGMRRAQAEARLAMAQAVVLALTVGLVAAISAQAPRPLAALALLATLGGMEGTAGLMRAAEQRGAYREAVTRLDALVGGARSAAAAASPPAGDLVIDGCRLAAGARVALVGPSGCGKTRMLEALVGLRDAPPSRFQIGDVPLETVPVGAARALFTFAPQDARLLTGTVAETLRLADPTARDDALWAVLAEAQLDDRVRRLPKGLGAWIGDGGEILSGGERRRLSLARAFLRHAPWLLLDEPTEGLDAATEAALIAALERRLRRTGQGVVIVSHRPAPLALCSLRIDVGATAAPSP